MEKKKTKEVKKIKLKKISVEEFSTKFMKHNLAKSFEIVPGTIVKIGTKKPFRLVPSKFYDQFSKEIKSSIEKKVDRSFYAKYPFMTSSFAYNQFVIVDGETFVFSFVEESFVKSKETFEL